MANQDEEKTPVKEYKTECKVGSGFISSEIVRLSAGKFRSFTGAESKQFRLSYRGQTILMSDTETIQLAERLLSLLIHIPEETIELEG